MDDACNILKEQKIQLSLGWADRMPVSETQQMRMPISD